MNDMLSIIIPVHNSSNFLNRCFKSLINQSYKNLEVILIDDGSTDDSPKICDEFCKVHNFAKCIHTKGGGVSNARNLGISISSGEYIAFLDSDDYVSDNFYEKLMNAGGEMCFGTIIVDRDGVFKRMNEIHIFDFVNDIKNIYYFIVDDFEKELPDEIIKNRIFGSVCRSIFKRSIIFDNNIFFDEKISIGEDLLFMLKYLTHVERAHFCDAFYFYCFNSNSSTSLYCGGYLPNFLDKYELLTKRIIETISDSKMTNDLIKKTIDYQKMKFVLSFVVNETKLASVYSKQKLTAFFQKKENKELLKFKISKIGTSTVTLVTKPSSFC